MATVSMARPAALLRRLFFRDRSDGETQEREHEAAQEREDRAMRLALEAEAEFYADKIVETLTRKGVCYRYTKSERDEIREYLQEVQFEFPFHATKDTIKLKIDTRRLPRGVGLKELTDPENLRLCSINCRHNVFYEYNTECGLWLIVERESGVGGVPRHLSFEDAMAGRPPSLEGERLAFPVGIGANHKVVWRTVTQVVNMLVAGSPKWGKSNFVNGIICTLLKHNRPDQLKLMLIDLKGGLEFSFYSELDQYLLSIPKPKKLAKAIAGPAPAPRDNSRDDVESEPDPANDPLLFDESEEPNPEELDPAEPDVVLDRKSKERMKAFIERREEVPAALSFIIDEAERRMKMIRDAGCKTIGRYNQKHSHRPLPYILVVIDEWADVKLTPRVGARAEERLINVSNRARAVGIHTILCTQSPNKDVVGTRITNAMNTRVVFHCANQYMSQALVQDYSATELQPQGRCLFMDGDAKSELQTAYMPDETVREVVEAARGGQVTQTVKPARHDVTETEILRWALASNNGSLGWRDLFKKFGERKFSADEAKQFGRRLTGQVVTVNDRFYRVAPSTGLPNPRPVRLLPVTGEAETPAVGGQAETGHEPHGTEMAETPEIPEGYGDVGRDLAEAGRP